MKKLYKILFVLIVAVGSIVIMNACDDAGSCSYEVSGFYSGVSSARLFYPCNISDLSNVGASTLSGGFSNTKEDMYWLADSLRNNGLIIVAISASNNLTVSGYELAQKGGHQILISENNNPGSPIYGKVGNRGLMGYSMGGGGTVQAAHDLGSQVTTAVGIAPFGASSILYGISAATLIIVGSIDPIAPPIMAYGTYHNLPNSIPRAYAEVFGKTHLFWINQSNPGNSDDFILAWLKYYLEGDGSYYSTLTNPPFGIVDYEFQP